MSLYGHHKLRQDDSLIITYMVMIICYENLIFIIPLQMNSFDTDTHFCLIHKHNAKKMKRIDKEEERKVYSLSK